MKKSTELNASKYWSTNLTLVGILLMIWFSVSFGCGILFKEQLDQYLKNVNNSDSRLKIIDANLQNLTTIMVRANELMIQASSDVLGPSDREAIAIELDQMKEQAIGLANQQDAGGAYLFSGYKTKAQPFVKVNFYMWEIGQLLS